MKSSPKKTLLKNVAIVTITQILIMLLNGILPFLIYQKLGNNFSVANFFLYFTWLSFFIALTSEGLNIFLVPQIASVSFRGLIDSFKKNKLDKKLLQFAFFVVIIYFSCLCIFFKIRGNGNFLFSILSFIFSLPSVVLINIFFSYRQFVLPIMVSGIPNLTILISLFFFSTFLSGESLLVIYFFSAIIQLIILMYFFTKKSKNIISISSRWLAFLIKVSIKDIKNIFDILLICIVVSIPWLVPLIERTYASKFPNGLIIKLTLCWSICFAISNILSRSFTQVIFSQLSVNKNSKNLIVDENGEKYINYILSILIFGSIIIVVGINFFSDFLIKLIFDLKKNNLTESDTIETIKFLKVYSWTIPFLILYNFYSKKTFLHRKGMNFYFKVLLTIFLYLLLLLLIGQLKQGIGIILSNIFFWSIISFVFILEAKQNERKYKLPFSKDSIYPIAEDNS